jgi:hypothetical protein
MRRCWLIIITKGLRVSMPPEVYLERRMAARERRRWITTFKPGADAVLDSSPVPLGSRRLLHVIETDFLEPWRACPLWIGVRWSGQSFPRLSAHLLAADSEEAAAWVRRRSRKALDPSEDPELRFECSFERKGVPAYVGMHRAKRLGGF